MIGIVVYHLNNQWTSTQLEIYKMSLIVKSRVMMMGLPNGCHFNLLFMVSIKILRVMKYVFWSGYLTPLLRWCHYSLNSKCFWNQKSGQATPKCTKNGHLEQLWFVTITGQVMNSNPSLTISLLIHCLQYLNVDRFWQIWFLRDAVILITSCLNLADKHLKCQYVLRGTCSLNHWL